MIPLCCDYSPGEGGGAEGGGRASDVEGAGGGHRGWRGQVTPRLQGGLSMTPAANLVAEGQQVLMKAPDEEVAVGEVE